VKPIRSQWVFVIKHKSDGSIVGVCEWTVTFSHL
jgi:hypothetical protein